MPAANRPRAVWTGAISFGLVNAPVRMYTAIAEKDLRFNQLHVTDGGRIGYVKVCKVDNEPVPADEIVKGYEISKGEYVQMSDEDFEAARSESHRSITIHDFVPADQIDPIYFERTYYLGPEEGPGEAIYTLLVQAMEKSGLSAIATYVQSDRENLACLRVRDGVITLERMFFDDEVRSIDGIAPGSAKVDKQQLKMAEDLIAAYTSDFEPGRYSDTYRDRRRRPT
jgi:DNA end-binding protein Ku